jgi:hypothetical protein
LIVVFFSKTFVEIKCQSFQFSIYSNMSEIKQNEKEQEIQSFTCDEIAFQKNVYEEETKEQIAAVKKVYSVARKTFKLLWNSMIENDQEIDNLKEKVSVGNGEISMKGIQEILYILAGQTNSNKEAITNLILPQEYCFIPGKSNFVDLGSGYGLTLMHAICYTQGLLSSYVGIEVEQSRLRKSQEFAEALGYAGSALTIIQDSFNSLHNPTVKSAMTQGTHFYSFDWVMTEDTRERLASFLCKSAKKKQWKVFVSFWPMRNWKKFGLNDVATCFGKLPRRKMGSQSMTAYFYLNKHI